MVLPIIGLIGAFITFWAVVWGKKGMGFIIGLGFILMIFGFGFTSFVFTNIPWYVWATLIVLLIYWMSKK